MKFAQHTAHNPNFEKEKKNGIIKTLPVVALKKLKGPAHMVDGAHHLRKRSQPPPNQLIRGQEMAGIQRSMTKS